MRNFSWLSLLQAMGYIFSFLALPVIISKFGYEKAGLIFLAQAVFTAMSGLASYSLTYFIPFHSRQIFSDRFTLNRLWNLAVHTRFWLSLILYMLFAALFLPHLNNKIFWILSAVLLLPKIINPVPFYHALEKNHRIFLIHFFSKGIFLLFLLTTSNFLYVNPALGAIEFAVTFLFLRKEKWTLQFISAEELIIFLKKSFKLFLVNFFSLLKPLITMPAIAYFFGTSVVTSFALADKVINVVRGIAGAGFFSYYPVLNKEKFNPLNRKIITGLLIVSTLLAIIIWVLSPYVIFLLNGLTPNPLSTEILRLLTLSIPFTFLGVILFAYLLENKQWNTLVAAPAGQFLFFVSLLFVAKKNIILFTMVLMLSEIIIVSIYAAKILKIISSRRK